jgi:hypothetical protein
MLKKGLLFCALSIFCVIAVFAEGNWDVSGQMTLSQAIEKATAVAKEKYPSAAAYQATLKFQKSGAKYEVKFKVEDKKGITVDVKLDGKTKLKDKKGKLYNVSKSSQKNRDFSKKNKKSKKSKRSKKK